VSANSFLATLTCHILTKYANVYKKFIVCNLHSSFIQVELTCFKTYFMIIEHVIIYFFPNNL